MIVFVLYEHSSFFICCSKSKFTHRTDPLELMFQELTREDIPVLDKELKKFKKFFADLGCINLDKTTNVFTAVCDSRW